MANQIGADGYLLKPTRFDDLKKLVKSVYDQWLTEKPRKKAVSRKAKAAQEDSIPDTNEGATLAEGAARLTPAVPVMSNN